MAVCYRHVIDSPARHVYRGRVYALLKSVLTSGHKVSILSPVCLGYTLLPLCIMSGRFGRDKEIVRYCPSTLWISCTVSLLERNVMYRPARCPLNRQGVPEVGNTVNVSGAVRDGTWAVRTLMSAHFL
jgi:hypothetical protein